MHTLRRSRSSASQCPAAPILLPRKLVVLGDANSGKTCLLQRLCHGEFPGNRPSALGFEDYVRVEDSYQVRLMLVDTNAHYDRLYPLWCLSTDVALVCFAIDCRDSLERVASHWKPQVLDKLCPAAPVILVGTKADLRDTTTVTREEALKVAESIGAATYLDCSARLGDGVRELFDTAVRIVARAAKDSKVDRRKSKCALS